MNKQLKFEPIVELLWWSGCPSHEKAFEMLAAALNDAGLDSSCITRVQMVTMDEAKKSHFIGSPTIRINGRDIVPPDPADQPALTCRLYFKANGRPSPLPDQERINKAILSAIKIN